MTTYVELIEAAASLVSENDENPEYDRGLAELIANTEVGAIHGMPLNERAPQILQAIRRKQAALLEELA